MIVLLLVILIVRVIVIVLAIIISSSNISNGKVGNEAMSSAPRLNTAGRPSAARIMKDVA